MPNIVYIATSLDGYIADKDNNIDWLHDIPDAGGSDLGFQKFMSEIDALIMGRNTMEKVLSFGVDWPYNKPVYVLSDTLDTVPEGYESRIFLVRGKLADIVTSLHRKGLINLYVDGGKTIQSFLKEDMIDQLIVTTIPVLLGGGVPLFGVLDRKLKFRHTKSERHLNYLVTNYYERDI